MAVRSQNPGNKICISNDVCRQIIPEHELEAIKVCPKQIFADDISHSADDGLKVGQPSGLDNTTSLNTLSRPQEYK
ncbi:unnamed protein product [Leptosia nina]|uniref:Uncharacterized protein n=1 Tax=Leptosia nina TaxID=320188 RepID=A0AAV1JFK2_9NEOP